MLVWRSRVVDFLFFYFFRCPLQKHNAYFCFITLTLLWSHWTLIRTPLQRRWCFVWCFLLHSILNIVHFVCHNLLYFDTLLGIWTFITSGHLSQLPLVSESACFAVESTSVRRFGSVLLSPRNRHCCHDFFLYCFLAISAYWRFVLNFLFETSYL